MAEKILIVEDDLTLQETLAYNLQRQGYEVQAVGDGLKALDAARGAHPDLILLDVMLPGLNGFEVCRILRREMNVPVLMLTARDEEMDRVNGLELGADDYMTKPFSMRELMARVHARLRQVRLIREEMSSGRDAEEAALLSFGDLAIDLNRHEVRLRGDVLWLKPKEFDLLLYLAQHQGQVLSRDTLLERVWGWEYTGDSRTVDVHVHWLREKIETDPANPRRLLTVRGAGYCFDG